MCLQFRLTVPRSRTNLPKKKKRLTPVQQDSKCFRKQALCMWPVGGWATRGPAGGMALGRACLKQSWVKGSERHCRRRPASTGLRKHGVGVYPHLDVCLAYTHLFGEAVGPRAAYFPSWARRPPCETRSLDGPPFQSPPSPGASLLQEGWPVTPGASH